MASVRRHFPYTATAPIRQGIYSQAVVVDRTMYISGQIGMDVAAGQVVEGGVQAQAKQFTFAPFDQRNNVLSEPFLVLLVNVCLTLQALVNMGAILKAAGCDYTNVVKTTVLLADINDFNSVNEVYKQFFSCNFPARAAYQVAALPRGALVEIEAIAVLGPISDS